MAAGSLETPATGPRPDPARSPADALAPAKQPVSLLAGRYGHPVHPALVALPIGAWLASFIFDLASYAVDDPAILAHGSRWLIGIGVLGAALAAMLGFLDLLAIPTGTRAFRTGLGHMSLALGATTAYAVGFAIRGAEPAAPVPAAPLVLSGLGLAAVTAAGYLGGTLAYSYGVRVADERTQARALRRLASTHAKERPEWTSRH